MVGLCGLLLLARAAAAPSAVIEVLGYDVRLEPDIQAGTLRGRTTIAFRTRATDAAPIAFDAGDLTVDSVRLDGRRASFQRAGGQLVIDAGPLAARQSHTAEVFYHGAPTEGLAFHPERSELYTSFSTSQWMVCLDAPDVRAPLRLGVVLPEGLEAVGSGTLEGKVPLGDGKLLSTWRQDAPTSSFLYGFAAGKYRRVTQSVDGIKLAYLSADQDAAALQRLFADTGDMLRFFGERTGVAYQGEYAQVLVARTIGQEAAGFALLSEAYGQRVLQAKGRDPTAQALIAHEIAHQWWGVRVTARDWNHFWLNEGFAVFMAAVYIESRSGSDAYRELVDGWRSRVRAVQERGNDHALVYDTWAHPTADDRTIVYQKGAYVLHRLRQELGDAAFWRGIRAYVRSHQGRSVTTSDLQLSMEQATGRGLRAFFAEWVYGAAGRIE